ncbi:MFS transporter [Actinocorallia longicatena]|uniref:MFS transporter n=1 Tax=Actinocorallia longicatena TaxID=111803 RepID=A0ABP6QM29_9ACTN
MSLQAETAAGTAPAARTGPVLPVLMTATFMTSLDFFIVNVAMPSLRTELHAGTAQLQWVVAGFGLALAAGLITGGRLGDLYGRRRVFAAGLALFTAASLVCGVAPGPGVLIAGRVLQGLGAALIQPQVLAILRTSFHGPAQGKAFSVYGLTLGLGAVFGQLIGGVLIQLLDWRWVFLINLPIGIVALVLARRIPESADPSARLDPVGAVLVTTALAGLVLPLIEGREQGRPAWTWLSLAGSAVLFAVFVTYERRRASPLVDMTLFRERAFTVGLAAQLVYFLGMASYFLILALYLQDGLGLTALESGTAFLAIGIGYMGTSMVAHLLKERLGRQVIAAGALIMVAGLALMYAAAGHGIGPLLPGMAVDGIGMGMALAPLTTTILERVTPRHAGAAGGVLSAFTQVGNALGVALIGIVFYHFTDITDGFREGLLALIVLELVLAGVIQFLPRR